MMFSLSFLMSMPDEEFDVLGEDELALLTRRFERLHENRVKMRRNTRTCFQCGKPGHFVADCPEKVENKDGQGWMASTYRGMTKRASTRTNTRTSDDQGRRRAEARPERWWERATSSPVPLTPPRAQVAVKMKVVVVRAGSCPRTRVG
jgi:choline dehydrogenase-like flavoprotein